MNLLVILLPLLLITLSACSSGTAPYMVPPTADVMPPVTQQANPASTDPMTPAQPIPPAAPPAPTIPMPAHRVFVADWSQPSIGLTGFIDRYTPPRFSSGDPNAKWFTNPGDGLGGRACIDPAPNSGYHTDNGCLVLTPGQQPPNTGFPIISAQTFSKDFHLAIDCEIWFDDIGQFGSYAGPVLDNGEPNYVSLYGQNCGDNAVSLIIDQYVKGAPPMGKLVLGAWHNFRIHYYPDGTLRFAWNGIECAPTGIDNPMPLLNDPRLSVFAGGFAAVKIRKLEVWSDNPNAVEV